MSNRNIEKILDIFSSDLSEKEMIERVKKYPKDDVQAAERRMLSGVIAVKDLSPEETQ